MNSHETAFIYGFGLALIIVISVGALFNQPTIYGVQCGFTTAEAPRNSSCEVVGPSLFERITEKSHRL